MKMPPRKLLKQANRIRANRPGTARMTRIVPAMSTRRGSAGASCAGAARGSSTRTTSRCRNASTVRAMAKTRV
ncbi:hypothetical protein D3C87_1908560 [compost metagenome]